MNSRLGLTLSALLTALCLSVALRAVADPATDSLRARSERATAVEQKRELARNTWQGEYRSLLANYQSAHERTELARYDWRSLRKRHRLRGDTRIEVRTEIEESQQELAAATDAIRSFHERARVEQTPPGWLYAVEDEFPDIVSAIASR